ncbi:hypothetical protein ACH5RR_025589 [Cinchona calisaya]|uniref:Late blight resistance protein homolog R1A-3 n=1 Tax=Cinchona calisaya TaxID=153742 RepID=A0ABD2Z394_9GENT
MDLKTWIDSVLKKLELHKDDDHHVLQTLKVEFRLVKTFLVCARLLNQQFYSLLGELGKGLPPPSALLQNRLHAHLYRLEVGLVPCAQHLYILLHRLEDGYGLLPSHLAGTASKFHQVVNSFKQEVTESFAKMSAESLNYASSPSRDKFMEFFHSLLENLEDILIWSKQACDSRLETLLEPLQEKLVFLNNFIRFSRMQGKDEHQLMEHFGGVAVSAAYLCYLCWFSRDDDRVFDGMDLKILELMEKIKPRDQQVSAAYIGILEFRSFTLSTNADMLIAGNFVDSLLSNLWDLLLNCGASFMVSLKHQMRILYEGLHLLRNILMKHRDKYNGLHERKKDLIGAVVNDAGVVIFSLYQNRIDEALAKEQDVKIFRLLEKIKLIKVELQGKYPATVRFNFPTTNELRFIDLLLENLTQLEICNVDPISFAKDRVEAVQNYRLFLESYLQKTVEHPTRYPNHEFENVKEDLVFFTSFLEDYMEQHKQHQNLQVQTLREDLIFLRSFLENTFEQCNQLEELQALCNHIIEVAYKAEFVIDSLIVGDISFYSLMLFHNVKEEIKLVKTKTLEIDDQRYLTKAKKATKSLRNVPSQGSISIINKVVVGLEDEAQAIMDHLIRGSKQFDIVSIVGMPGIGKTTMAQKLYRHPSITSHFHICGWCCISQVQCKKDWLMEILACIDQKAQYSEMNEDDLAEKLRKLLKKKKYLIVLDDVWDIEAWNALKGSFPDDDNGSRILLTSRHHELALSVKPTGKLHPLRLLTDEESWELLQKKLEITTEEGYPPALSVLGRQIAKKCNGLPLSIVIISGILATLDQVGWEEVAERLCSNMVGDTEQCKKILEMSYRHLPDHLKPCLLYFATFQKDQEIPIRRLVFLLIAELFVLNNEWKNPEKIAEDYIMALINRSLVMVGRQRSIGGVKTCSIHDLLHDFCVAKAKDENFLQLIQGYEEFLNFDEPDNLRRLCIHSQPKHFMKSRLFCSRIRSILFSACGRWRIEILNKLSFVFHLKLLRVLDLAQIFVGVEFPNEITILFLLRFVAVLGGMKNIPSSIANLTNLETFLVTTNCNSGKLLLPDSFFTMQKLRHLHVCGAWIDLSLAKDKLDNSSNLHNLCTFSTPQLYLGKTMDKIMTKFPNIHNLKCSLLESEESTGDSKTIVAMDLPSQLESLKLLLGNVTSHHLLELHLPFNLKKLTLEEFSWSIISTIAKLPNLEVLKLLQQVDGVEKWDMEEKEFPKLKFLKLENLNIVKWTGIGDHFPCLEKLVLEYCKKLEELPSCLVYISTLEWIEVHRCPDTVGSLVRDVKQELMNGGYLDLKILISEETEDTSSGPDSDSDSAAWSG